MFHKMPLILLAIIVVAVCIDGFLPLQMKEILYALSMTIKSLIVFVLPAVIFMLLFKTLSRLASGATTLIFLLLVAVCFSNFISTLYSYKVGSAIYNLDFTLTNPAELIQLAPAWSWSFPIWIANDKAMFAGLILGILGARLQPVLTEKISSVFDRIVHVTMRCIIAVIPVFIAGFAVKLIHDKMMESIVRDYSLIFALVAIAQGGYILCIYLVANGFSFGKALRSLRNMLPAAIVGFGSMSSAASMPLTLIGAEKNTQDPELTRLVIPTTVNIHLIGDCLAIPIFAFAVMKNFGVPEPAFITYLVFALYFVLAKFSVAAIPGGGIIVMLPILESHLGFTTEMSSLITALYILFDPVITCTNICGNGGFAMIIDRVRSLSWDPKTVKSPVS